MNRATRFHEYLQSGLEDVMSFYDYEHYIAKINKDGTEKDMRYTFYYDDKPEAYKRILRLDNPKLVNGYIVHLKLTLDPDRFSHVRVLKEWSDMNGEIQSVDKKLNDLIAEEEIA